MLAGVEKVRKAAERGNYGIVWDLSLATFGLILGLIRRWDSRGIGIAVDSFLIE
jgi:hypothetical protein